MELRLTVDKGFNSKIQEILQVEELVNIKDKVMKYDNCGTCKMENTENL